MTQPDYVPITGTDQVRPLDRLQTPPPWKADRPAELAGPSAPMGPRLGSPGPDLGYALLLARRFTDRLVLAEGDHVEDAVAGCTAVAMRRASLFGRAPIIHDCELAFTLWGFLGGAPEALVVLRSRLFASAAHHYWDQRGITDRVREETLRLTPIQVRERLGQWESLLVP